MLGALTLALVGGAALKANAQGSVNIRFLSLNPSTVNGGGQAQLRVRVSGRNIAAVTARTRAGNGLPAGPISTLTVKSDGRTYEGGITAPGNSTGQNRRVGVEVIVQRNTGNPVTRTVANLTVRSGGGGGGPDQPPPPPF
jgi:hypothetical protein